MSAAAGATLLTDDMWRRLMRDHLGIAALQRSGATCVALHRIAMSDAVWRGVYERYFAERIAAPGARHVVGDATTAAPADDACWRRGRWGCCPDDARRLTPCVFRGGAGVCANADHYDRVELAPPPTKRRDGGGYRLRCARRAYEERRRSDAGVRWSARDEQSLDAARRRLAQLRQRIRALALRRKRARSFESRFRAVLPGAALPTTRTPHVRSFVANAASAAMSAAAAARNEPPMMPAATTPPRAAAAPMTVADGGADASAPPLKVQVLRDRAAPDAGTVVVDVPMGIVRRCQTLANIVADLFADGEDVRRCAAPVPLRDVDVRTLSLVVEYAALGIANGEPVDAYDRASQAPAAASTGGGGEPSDGTAVTATCNAAASRGFRIGEEWRREFVYRLSSDELLAVNAVSNYLHQASLHDACLRRITRHVCTLSTDQIRDAFGLPDDLSAEEKKQIEDENAWAYDDDDGGSDDDDDEATGDMDDDDDQPPCILNQARDSE